MEHHLRSIGTNRYRVMNAISSHVRVSHVVNEQELVMDVLVLDGCCIRHNFDYIHKSKSPPKTFLHLEHRTHNRETRETEERRTKKCENISF